MNRLPCFDRATCCSEAAVFLSLGLAGAIMIAMAGTQTTKFVAGSDRIAASLAERRSPTAARTAADHRPRPVAQADVSPAARHGAAIQGTSQLAVSAPRPVWR